MNPNHHAGRPLVHRAATVFAAAGLAAAVLTGCGSSGHSKGVPASPSAGAGATIVIKNFSFQPSNLEVAPGVTVTVRNEDSATHTVTASGGHGGFDTGDIAEGATATFKAPSASGSYPYICQIHQFMHGTLTVT